MAGACGKGKSASVGSDAANRADAIADGPGSTGDVSDASAGRDEAPTDRGADVRVGNEALSDATIETKDTPVHTGATDGGQDVSKDDACAPRRCGFEIACGVAADGCGNSVTCDPCPDIGRPLRLPGSRHLVFDRTRGVAYVTMAGSSPTYANMLLVVAPTPTVPKVTDAIPIGAEPNVVALSDDGSRLWVGIDGAFAIREVELGSSSPVPGDQFALPQGGHAGKAR
jgi:hypothetical protein